MRRTVPETDLATEVPAMRAAVDLAVCVAATDAALLIRGESGTGKGVLARQVGGVPVERKGADFTATVADYVRRRAITHLVVGRSRRPWHARLFRPSPTESLLRRLTAIDVTVCGDG